MALEKSCLSASIPISRGLDKERVEGFYGTVGYSAEHYD